MKLFIFSLFHFTWFITCLHFDNDQCSLFSNNSSSFLQVEIECIEKSNETRILDLGQILKVYDKEDQNLFPNQMLAYKLTIKNKVFERILCTIETLFTQSLVSLTLAYNKIEAIDRDSFTYLSKLTSLSLIENNLNRIEADSFQTLINLR